MSRLKTQAEKVFADKGLKESTINNYMRNLTKIIDNAGVKSITNKTKDKIATYIDSIPNLGTRKNFYKVLTSLLVDNRKKKDVYKFFLDKLLALNPQITKKLKKNKFKDKELENKVEWKDIKKIKMEDLTDDMKIVFSMIKNDNLFLRLEYFTIKLKNFDKDNDNYIEGNTLVMNKFKNVKEFGAQRFRLSKKTMSLVKKRGEQEYLLDSHSLAQSSKSEFISRMFKKGLGKPINNNLLRKIYINEVLKKFNKMTNEQLEKKARRMLNTPQMWIEIYRKVD